MKIIVSPEAVSDLERLRIFLHDKNPDAANRAATALVTAIQSLSDFADRGRPAGELGIRELIVPFSHSAYVIRYRHFAESSEVVILRIFHGREERG